MNRTAIFMACCMSILMFVSSALATAIDESGRSTLVITFTNGSTQRFNMSEVARIEVSASHQPAPVAPTSKTQTVPTKASLWEGTFGGSDTSGYPMDIRLQVRNGVVTGGYSYFHKVASKQVRAVITDTSVQGDTLTGRWKQVEGIIAEGRFVWKWLPNQQGKAFEGSFDNIKYWHRMTRQ